MASKTSKSTIGLTITIGMDSEGGRWGVPLENFSLVPSRESRFPMAFEHRPNVAQVLPLGECHVSLRIAGEEDAALVALT